MKNIFAIFKKIKISKKHKKEEPKDVTPESETSESVTPESETSESVEPSAEKSGEEAAEPAKQDLAEVVEKTEDQPAKKRKFPAPPKLKSPFQGKRKILVIVLVGILAAGAGTGFALLKLGIISNPMGEKKTESSKAESGKAEGNTSKESSGAEGEAAAESKPAEPQIAKITVTAIDIDLGALEGHLASDYIKILRTQNYTIHYRTTTVYNGQPYEIETIYAVYGENIALSSGDRSTVILNQNVYMMDHTNKTMISWRATQTENLRTIDTSDMAFAGSSESNGLTCEEYTTATARIKFFFRDGALVEIVTVINNQDVDMDILEFKEGVPMDLFVVPGDYQNTNITDTISDGQRP